MAKLPPSSFFSISVNDGLAHVELNNPDKANSMTSAFWDELPVIVAELDADPAVRVIVLSGRGKHFTSGMDLAAFEGILRLTKEEPGRAAYALRDLVLKLQRSLSSLEDARVPVIAAVHGACLGGGIDLISACDIRIASADASFGIEEIHIGMAADVGTLQRLPKLMAPGVVRELAYTGRRFSAQEAMGWGIVNAVHTDRDATISAAMEMARDISIKSPLAIAGIKKAVTYARDHSVADALDQIATWNGGMLRPDDLTKAIEAKIERRQVVFADLLPDAD